MPKLPSYNDVQRVSPEVQRDPGVAAPVQAFQSASGIAAAELAPAIDAFQQAAVRQENRRDTVDRADKINRFQKEMQDELTRLNVESDLSREDVLQEYGNFLSKKRDALLQEHGGTQDSRAMLTMRLQDIESEAIGRAAGLSTSLGREKVVKTFNSGITPIVSRVAESPTRENLQKAFLEVETHLGDVRGALDPNEEEALRSGAREQVSLSVMETLVSRGRIESAAALLDDPDIVQTLSPETQRNVRRTVENARYTRDETKRKITEAEAFLGRPLNKEERERIGLGLLGLTSDKPSERDKRIQELRRRGFSQELSEDIASDDVRVVGPDNFGKFFRVNVATGESTPVEKDDVDAIERMINQTKPTDSGEPSLQPDKTGEPESSLDASIKKGTGPVSNVQAAISATVGPWMEGAIFKDTTDSRQHVRTFTQLAKIAIVNNPKFPVAEQEIVNKLLPDPGRMLTDPDTERSNLKQLEKVLITSRESKRKELSRKITSDRRGELADQISRIDEIVDMMKEPKKISIRGKEYNVGEEVKNSKGQRGRVEADGTITVIK